MRRILRVLVLLFLMTVIPVRGAIGASMMLCGPAHGGWKTTLQYSAGPIHHADHSWVAAHHHTSPIDGDGHDHEAAASAHDHAGSGNTVHHGAVTCSLCADCCAGGSILVPAALTVPVVELVDELFPPILVRFERRPPDGLERPPHSLLV